MKRALICMALWGDADQRFLIGKAGERTEMRGGTYLE